MWSLGHERSQKPSREQLEAMKMVREISQAFSDEDTVLSTYFSSVGDDDIILQRPARDDFSRRLELARTTPTVVTVRARGDNCGGTFLIIEASKVKQMARSFEEEDRMETITDRMRKIREEIGVELSELRIERSQRPRSSVPRIGRKAVPEGDI